MNLSAVGGKRLNFKAVQQGHQALNHFMTETVTTRVNHDPTKPLLQWL